MENDKSLRPIWEETAIKPDLSPLAADTKADVVVVGAGISGLTTAYLLGREGKSVVVLDGGPIARAETFHTTAHLTSAMDDGFVKLEKVQGLANTRLAAESHQAAIDQIEQLVQSEGIDCDFRRVDGFLFGQPGEDASHLKMELAAANRAGLIDAEMVARAPIDGFDSGPAIRFPRQAQFNPVRYVTALAQAIIRNGGRIHSESQVTSIVGGPTASVLTAQEFSVTANAVIVATNSPINDRVVMHTKQTAYRSYVIAAPLKQGSVTKALYWDMAEPYHYARIVSDNGQGDMLVVGGEDHRTGQSDDGAERFHRLEQWAQKRFPISGVKFRWSGQVMEPVDCLGFIGHNPWDEENVYIVTGDSGQGMTHGTLAGMILADLVCGRENPWTELYSPSRPSAANNAEEFLRDGLNIARQYAQWLTPGEVEEAENISLGCGAILRRGPLKVAAFRDKDGTVHECAAICPHLGGIVNWNDAEKTWDCPVHGSRFDRFGKVLNGPAAADLHQIRPSDANS